MNACKVVLPILLSDIGMHGQVHTIVAGQSEALHNSVGLVSSNNNNSGQNSASNSGAPQASATPPRAAGEERDLAEQLLETWMLLEYCDQGNLEAAAREARFKDDFVRLPLVTLESVSLLHSPSSLREPSLTLSH